MAADFIDRASFGHCRECGDEIVLKNANHDEVVKKQVEVARRGGTCDLCDEGATQFEKQVRHQVLQWLGPEQFRKNIATIIEPQNATHAVVTLKDKRTAKIFRDGESGRRLQDEIEYVFTHGFPDLKRIKKPGEG